MQTITKDFLTRAAIQTPTVLSAKEIDAYLNVLTSSFICDPVIRWMYPDATSYFTYFPKFLRAFGGPAFDERTALTSDNGKACAIWLAPGSSPNEQEIIDVLIESVATNKQDDLFATLSDMDAAHPTYPHWYLPWLGTDMSYVGEGHGSMLLSQSLATIDKANLPCYLETPNPKTIPFYRRHGFEIVGTSENGSCPVITFMERRSQIQR